MYIFFWLVLKERYEIVPLRFIKRCSTEKRIGFAKVLNYLALLIESQSKLYALKFLKYFLTTSNQRINTHMTYRLAFEIMTFDLSTVYCTFFKMFDVSDVLSGVGAIRERYNLWCSWGKRFSLSCTCPLV